MHESKWKIKNVDTGDLFILDSPVISVGRGDDEIIVCRSPLISRKHVEFLVFSDEKLRIVDKNTKNGTYVNGRKVPSNKHYQLNHGDLISLGFNPEISSKPSNKGPYYTFKVLFDGYSDFDSILPFLFHKPQ